MENDAKGEYYFNNHYMFGIDVYDNKLKIT